MKKKKIRLNKKKKRFEGDRVMVSELMLDWAVFGLRKLGMEWWKAIVAFFLIGRSKDFNG